MKSCKHLTSSSIDSMMGMAVIGALNAYQFYGNILVKNPTQDVWPLLMKTAGTFIQSAPPSDADITALIASFTSTAKYDNATDVLATFSAFSAMWSKIKLNGLASKTTVNSWITTNYPNFDPSQFTTFKQNFLFNLYCDLFFMQMFNGPLSQDAEPYFPTAADPTSGKQAASAMLQMYSLYIFYDNNYDPVTNPDTPPAFSSSSPSWSIFVKQANDYFNGLNLTQQGPNYTGFYANLKIVNNAIISLAIPDPYSDFRDYFSSILISSPNINGPFWTTLSNWGDINSDLTGIQAITATVLQFQTLLNSATPVADKYAQLQTSANTVMTSAQPYTHLASVSSIMGSLQALTQINVTFGIYLPDATGAPNGGTKTGLTLLGGKTGQVLLSFTNNYPSFGDIVGPFVNGNQNGVLWLPDPNTVGYDHQDNPTYTWSQVINAMSNPDTSQWVEEQWTTTPTEPYGFDISNQDFSKPTPTPNCIFDINIYVPISQCFIDTISTDNTNINNFLNTFNASY